MAVIPRTKEDLESALPDIETPLHLKGLESTVEVYRDRYGIPHIRARSHGDAFFAQGFATAQDRLWQMECDRRRAYGRWAEYVGEGAVAQDVIMRRFQIRPTVQRDYRSLGGETRSILDAYAAGVNAFVESTGPLPIEYGIVGGEPDRWEPWDCLAVFKVRHILMGVFEDKLWRARLVNELGAERTAELLKGYYPGQLLIVPPGAEYAGGVLDGLEELTDGAETINWLRRTDAGSNSWVLAGSRTASGKPLLAGDPHRALDTPNVYYQNHLSCPQFDAIGLSFPGCPGFPHFGHNTYVAWCVTHAMTDYQDLYLERFKEGDPYYYRFQGEWIRADIHHEVISVRNAAPIDLETTTTRHGPVIAGDPAKGYGIAFKYTATDGPNHGAECLLEMLKASSVQELEESMRQWVDPCNNLLFADVDGNIGYLNRGKVPIRSIANAWLPVPGWTGEHEWEGFIPFEELPRSRNPETGYIVTANNRIVGYDYPYYLGLDFAPDYRARRIVDRIRRLSNATVEDMVSIHADSVSIPATVYTRLLSKVEPLDELSSMTVAKLAEWDGGMERDAVAPTLYAAFRDKLHRSVATHVLGPLAEEAFSATGRGATGYLRRLAARLVTMAQADDRSLLYPASSWDSLIAQSLSEGVMELRERLGGDIDSWRWGNLHYTRPRHTLSEAFGDLASLLDPPSMPIGGDGDTPQVGSYSPSDPFVVTGTSVARYVFDVSDWNKSRWAIPLGASGHPGSPHYADQAPTWAKVDLIPMLYDWTRIISEAESNQALIPTQ